ncbi:hypothetical protein BKA70DRAFT_1219437 [Coprinopsis sp. MPI-PUGE-AT-0042]|nr:hypothetical protein BKA70DRAFT_1219437 [Coprinopsis sp. MPI-PUGE-AT-0042]
MPDRSKVQKAADTRRRNQEREEEENRLREEETRAWDSVKPSTRGKPETKKRKSSMKDVQADDDDDNGDGDDDNDDDEGVEKTKGRLRPKLKSSSRTTRPPPAALLDDDSEDEEPKQPKIPALKIQKKSTEKFSEKKSANKNSASKKPRRQSSDNDSDADEEEDVSGLSHGDQEQRSDGESGSGSDEDDDEEMDEQSLETERPRVINKAVIAEVLDDHDLDGDVEIGSRPSSRAGTSYPASGEEGGPVPPLEDESEEQDEPVAKRKYKGAPKNPTGRKRSRSHVDPTSSDEDGKVPMRKAKKTQKKQRDETFGHEKPAVGPAKALKKSKGKASQRQQPDIEHAKLCLPSNGRWKELNLLDQPGLVQQVTRGAIEKVTVDFFLKCAWRNGGTSRLAYGKPILLEVAKGLQVDYPDVKDILNCLESDARYAEALSYLVVDRLVLLRNPVKVAGAQTIPLFKLGLGEECKERIAALCPLYVYVFPGVWKTVEGRETNQWVPNAKEPYTNPAIIETLKEAFFSSSNGAGTRHIDHFPVKKDKRQIPIPLLALAATGVHYGLYQYKDGSRDDKLPFSGNIFSSVYAAHQDALETLSLKSKKTFCRIMSTIFDLVAASKASTSGSGNDIFSVIELDEGDNDNDDDD